MPYTWGTTGICYRTDKVSPAPQSWNDLLNPSDALKGKVTMLATDRWMLGAGFSPRAGRSTTATPARSPPYAIN